MIRKEGNGPRPWRARLIDVDGKKRQRSFATKKLAEAWERNVQEQRARLHAGLEVQQGPITYDGLCELYLQNRPVQASDKWFERMLKYSRDEFGHILVRGLRSEDIGRWLHGLEKAPKTKKHILAKMRQVLRAGVEWGYVSQNPVRPSAIVAPGDKAVTPVLPFETWDEVLAVAAKIDQWYSPLVRFACATGLRPSELLELRWRDVNLQEKVAHVRGTKTDAAERTIYLSRPALAALDDLPRQLDRSRPVFIGKRGGKIAWRSWRNKQWYPALTAAGLEKRVPRQMRHTFATLALAQGVPLETVSKLMGHESIEVTARHYARWVRPVMERARILLDQFDQPEEQEEAK